MSIIESSNKDNNLPDMDIVAQSIKTINRTVPAIQDGSYSYFVDSIKMGSTVASNINEQITNALTTLPTALEKLKTVEAFALNIAKINTAEKSGEIDANTAKRGREQLEKRLNDGLSSVLLSFDKSTTELSESAERLSNYSKKLEVRLKDSLSTETANHKRAKADEDRENARLTTLEGRYTKMTAAVDEKRGGPTDELIAIIPDEKELSSLLDLGAEDAAAPEVAAAKKAVELAVTQIKKTLEIVGKTIEFEQLVDIRDQIFKAVQAQREIAYAAAKRVRDISETIGQLDIVKSAGDAMASTNQEVDKIVLTFSNFTNSIKNMDGEEITDTTINNLYNPMNSYLEEVRKAQNSVILS